MTMHELFDGSDPDLIERRERVIAAAKEAGVTPGGVTGDWTVLWFAKEENIERFYAIAYNAGLERAAEIAATTVCDKHIPTGVSIYGSRAARAIREEAKK